MSIKWQVKLKHVLARYAIGRRLFNTSFSKVMEERIVGELLNLKRGETICDVACGTGLYAVRLAGRDCQVHGIDISNSRIELARRIGKGHDCHFEVASAECLPFRSCVFDKATCVCSLEHFDDDERALAEMCRVLKPRGVLVLSVDSFTYEGTKESLREKHRNSYHMVNYYTIAELGQKLEKQGLSVQEYKYFINSRVSTLFYVLGITLRFGYLFKLMFPIAYPLSSISDRLWGCKDCGYRLAVKAKKTE